MPREGKRRTEKYDDTVLAYHRYLQVAIKERLNSIRLGPGEGPRTSAVLLTVLGLVFAIVGILVITLRPRHIYLTGVWPRFVGPFFLILALLCFGAASYLAVLANRKSNEYRRQLVFQPYGNYGVKIVHRSRIPLEKLKREEYKTGTTPHKGRKHRRDRGHGGGQGGQRAAGHVNRGERTQEKRAYRQPPDDRGNGAPSQPPYRDYPPKYQDEADPKEYFDDQPAAREYSDQPAPPRDERMYSERSVESGEPHGQPDVVPGQRQYRPRALHHQFAPESDSAV